MISLYKCATIIRDAYRREGKSDAEISALVWKLQHMLSQQPGRMNIESRINERAGLAATIAKHAENGMICWVESGRDCDGVKYSGQVHDPVPATMHAYWKLYGEIGESSDGPFYLQACKPSEAVRVEYTSRDLVMEAFEDGHPHVIYG